ncbi:MAG: Tat pathway signal protein [Rhodobacteraceae bacterium]|mgnify:FL=1|nr:MAG: Tat pathway signal protein [Paracoccaceae bacterium]
MQNRRNFLKIFSACAAGLMVPSIGSSAGFFSKAGDIRRIKFQNSNTGERVNTIYWIEGQYVQEALDEINYFMRDWRQNKVIRIDTANLDIISATQTLLDTEEPFELLSGYRTIKTNKMLARVTAGVARNSYHIKGMAADLRMRSRTVNQIGKAAESCNLGGIGRYVSSSFVHIDCGPKRRWRQ